MRAHTHLLYSPYKLPSTHTLRHIHMRAHTHLLYSPYKLTQQISREVDWQHNAHREHAHHHQQADDVPLEGKVVHRVLTTLVTDLLIPTACTHTHTHTYTRTRTHTRRHNDARQ